MNKNRIIIIDGNSLINRAFYGISRPMITREGVYTQGIYGFLTMFEKIMKDYPSGYAVVAFDRKAPTFRHEQFKDYKAGRKKMPMELAMQLPLLKEVLDAMRIKRLEIDGFEADDIIGTVAKHGENQGLEPLIITGDRDELQLATERTRVIITRKGMTEFDEYDEAAMQEKYGFSPTEFIDFKGLMGDSSDNIPGVPGVGEKTAQKLIIEFRTIENLLANLDKVDGEKLRKKLEDNADLARLSRRLAEINTNVPIEIDFDTFRIEEPDMALLVSLYVRLEFNSLLRRLKAGGRGEVIVPEARFEGKPASAEGSGVLREDDVKRIREIRADYVRRKQRAEYVIVRGEAEGKAMKEAALGAESYGLRVFSDQNHVNRPLIYGISIMLGDRCFYVPLEDALPEAVDFVRDVLASIKGGAVGHNILADLYALRSMGISDCVRTGFDTAVAQYLLEPSRKEYLLSVMMLEHLQEDFKEEKDSFQDGEQFDLLSDESTKWAEFGLSCCLAAEALADVLRIRLEAEKLSGLYDQAELPLIEALSSMETAGFFVDRAELTKVGAALSGGIEGLSERIYELAGERFNINSPAQLGVILFEKLGLPPSKKTKVGYATGADILEKLADKHEIINVVLEYRMLVKLFGTYVEGLLPLIGSDNRIHAHFQQTVTTTGRISCTEPNLQNIPIRQALGREIRRAFTAGSPDYVLVSADYSQIELRVLAHLSQDEGLMEDFRQGADIHRRTAARVFNMAEEDVDSLHRSRAKAVNFGVIYGMSGFGLSAGLGITRKEAELYIGDYFKAHPAVLRFMNDQIQQCREYGYVTTMLGRRRWIPEIKAGQYMVRQLGERLAMNTPVQGSAADIIKLAMIRVNEALCREKLRSRLILQVHDELIVETHRDELAEVTQLLRENMECAAQLSVPLAADINTGYSWYDLK